MSAKFNNGIVSIINKVLARSRPALEKIISKYSKVGDTPFFSPDQFPWVEELERNWNVIRKELNNILATGNIPNIQDVLSDQIQLTQDNKWKTFMLYVYGHERPENCAKCPETILLLRKIPGMSSAMFSILSPGKHLPEHRGPFNGVLRFHLGLIVPKEKTKCRIRVDNEFRYWEEGKSLFFDDSFNHEVWNDTDEARVVLFVDFARPLAFPLSFLNKHYIKYLGRTEFVKEAKTNLDRMAQNK